MNGAAIATLRAMGTEGGERLERYIRARWDRERGGMRRLAAEAGISADALYKNFKGESEPSLETLGGLASALGVRRYELVAVYDGDQPTLDWKALLDPEVRAQLVELVASLVDERLSD